jgi:HEAT repeat protein
MRKLAAQVLAAIGPKARAGASLLADALQDSDGMVRLWSAQALKEIGLDTVSNLLPVMKDKNPLVRLSAVQALTVFSDTREGAQALADALRDPEVKVRLAAADILVRLGPAARFALPGLLRNLEERNLELQSQAFTAIMTIGSFEDVSLLEGLEAINGKRSWIQVPPKPEHTLKSFLPYFKGDSTTRLGAVLALGQMGPAGKAALPRLSKLLADGNALVQAAAILAIAAIEPEKKMDLAKVKEIISDSLKELKSTRQPDEEQLIQLYILVSTVPHMTFSDDPLHRTIATARKWLGPALAKLPDDSDAVHSLVRGLNVTAHFGLGFTEPFSRLSLKLRSVVESSKDSPSLVRVFNDLGKGIPKKSPYMVIIQGIQARILQNSSFMESLILKRQQRIQLILQGNLQKNTAALSLAEEKLLAILSNNRFYWVPVPQT